MDKVAELLRKANECLVAAERAKDAYTRDRFTDLAEKWIHLAVERQNLLQQHAAAPSN